MEKYFHFIATREGVNWCNGNPANGAYGINLIRKNGRLKMVQDSEKHPVILIIGGRFREILRESRPVAEMLVEKGYHAFMLHNRMANGERIMHSLERALDVQRAVRYIRAHAEELRVNPDKIRFMGLSMGNRRPLI